MSELYFLGADIIVETKNLLNLTSVVCTDGMDENELKELVLAPQETISDLSLGGNGSEIIVDGDQW